MYISFWKKISEETNVHIYTFCYLKRIPVLIDFAMVAVIKRIVLNLKGTSSELESW